MKFNNQELNWKLKDILEMIKEGQEEEAWNCNTVTPVDVTFTWIDGYEDDEGNDIINYCIDFGDYHTVIYTSKDEAQADFDRVQKKWANKKVCVVYRNSSDNDGHDDWVGILQGHIDNKTILVNLALNQIEINSKDGDMTSVDELLRFVSKRKLIGFLPEEKAIKLGLL